MFHMEALVPLAAVGFIAATAIIATPGDGKPGGRALDRLHELCVPLKLRTAQSAGVNQILPDYDCKYWRAVPISGGRIAHVQEQATDGNASISIISRKNPIAKTSFKFGLVLTPSTHVSPDGKALLFYGSIVEGGVIRQGMFIIDLTSGSHFAVSDPGPDKRSDEAWMADSRHWVRMVQSGASAHFEVFNFTDPVPIRSFDVPVSNKNVYWLRVTNNGAICLQSYFQSNTIIRVNPESPNSPPVSICLNGPGWPVLGPDGSSILFIKETSVRPYGRLLAVPLSPPSDQEVVWVTLYTMRYEKGEEILHEVGYFMDDRRLSKLGVSEMPSVYDTIHWAQDGQSIIFRCYGWICNVPAWK